MTIGVDNLKLNSLIQVVRRTGKIKVILDLLMHTHELDKLELEDVREWIKFLFQWPSHRWVRTRENGIQECYPQPKAVHASDNFLLSCRSCKNEEWLE